MQQNKPFGGLATMFTVIGAAGVGYISGRFHMLSQAKKASPDLAKNGDVSVFSLVNKKKTQPKAEAPNA